MVVRPAAAKSATSSHSLPRRGSHCNSFVPLAVNTRPARAQTKKSAPAGTFTSCEIRCVRTSSSSSHGPAAESRWTKLTDACPGTRCNERPMSRAITSPGPLGDAASDEQHQGVRVGPRVVADRLDRVEHEAGPRSVEVERPQPLRGVGFDAHHREPRAVRQRRGGVLALAGRRDAAARPSSDVVAVDVRLTVFANRRIEERASVRQEHRLVVVARAAGDVDRRPDAGAAMGHAQLGEVNVGRGRTLQHEQRDPEHAET